jgi:hypothetical protein
MFPDMPALPGEPRHGPNSSTYLRLDIEQIGIDFAAVQTAIEKSPLVHCQIEQESKPVPAEHHGFPYPLVDALAGKSVAWQGDGELLPKLARITCDGIDRHDPPIAAPAGADGQNGGFDPAPVESVNRRDAARVEKITCGMPIDERNEFAGDLMEIEDKNVARTHFAERNGVHSRGAEQGLPGHIVHVDFRGGTAAKRGSVAPYPFTAACSSGWRRMLYP